MYFDKTKQVHTPSKRRLEESQTLQDEQVSDNEGNEDLLEDLAFETAGTHDKDDDEQVSVLPFQVLAL